MTKADRRARMIFSLAVVALVACGCARKLPPAERALKTNVVTLRNSFGVGADPAAATAAAPAAEPTGWATIRGSFKLSGPAPQRQALQITKDHEVCAPGGKSVLSEELVVDSSGGIKDVVIYLAGPGKFPLGDPKWEHPDYASAAPPDFDQKNCVFLTHMFAMRSKQKVKLLNSDPVGHNTNIQGGGRAPPLNATIPAGSSTNYEPPGESPEPFGVTCSIHPWMSSLMIVRDSPYFAVSKADGSFEIKNVPAGVPLEFRVWQEKSKFVQAATVNGTAEKWNKGRMKLTLAPDETKPLDVVLDAAIFTK
jgi:hypothetical protein